MLVLYSVPILPSKDVVSQHIITKNGIFQVEHLQDGASWVVGGMCPGRWGLDKPLETILKNLLSFQVIGWASFWVISDRGGGELVYSLFGLGLG